MLRTPRLDPQSETPLYRQLYDFIRNEIAGGVLVHGDRLPPTRELSSQIGLNRTTISAAYSMLESDGLIRGHVGRGSFVNYNASVSSASSTAPQGPVSFVSSRPADHEFPIAELQATVREVLASADFAKVLQLGSPTGYAPLRRMLLAEARREGTANADDDILITSGCQQALDLVQRVLVPAGSAVVVEDPVYHGVKNVFARAGVQLIPARVGDVGMEADGAVAHGSAAIIATPNFQNPTGTTMPLAARQRLLTSGATYVVENDIYGELRYAGQPLPTLKQLDTAGRVLLIRSFSKIGFPGLRVGWIIGPRAVIARLAEAKQWCDLHTDQLSQAVLLRFAESGRLAEHAERMRLAGRERLRAVLDACARHLPRGSRWTQPEGGMSLWVHLPEPLNAEDLARPAEQAGATYLPGRHFAVARVEPGTLRLSFGALSPEAIEIGMERLGRVFRAALDGSREPRAEEPAAAIV